jgi:hypothetical protein
VRPAAGWYKVAVWRGDCRAFLTDHAKMGAHFQFGSKWLKENEGRWIDAALEFIGSLGFDPAQFARLDLARTDLHIDLECEPPDVGEFLGEGWIGKSTAWAVYGKRGAGAQTVYIGRRRSPIMLRVYDKLAEARHDGDLAFWVDVWGRLPDPLRVADAAQARAHTLAVAGFDPWQHPQALYDLPGMGAAGDSQ